MQTMYQPCKQNRAKQNKKGKKERNYSPFLNREVLNFTLLAK